MGLRGYLLVDVVDDMEQREFINAVRKIEETPGIEFVDPVIGPHDMVIMVDAPITVEALAKKIRAKPWVKSVEVLRIVSMFERHKTAKMPLPEKLTMPELAKRRSL